MAYFDVTSYHDYIDLQNVSASGDPASAPVGGVYLFASGAQGSAKLFLQNEGDSSPTDIANLGGSFTLAGDGGSDQTIENGDTLTIAGGDGLSTAGSATDTITIDLDIDGMTAITTIADADLVIVDDGAGGTNRSITRGNFLGSAVADFSNGLTSTTLSASGDTDLNGALNVEGATTFQAAITATSFSGSGDFQAAGNAFIEGTLNVTGAATLAGGVASLAVSDLTDNRVVIAGTSGELEDDANFTFDGSTLAVGVSSDVNTGLSGSVNFYGGYAASPVGLTYEKTNGDLLGKGNLFLQGSGSFLGGYSSSGVSISTAGFQSKLAGEFGQDGQGVDFTVYGTDSGEKMFYDASENILQVTGGAVSGLDVKIGGDSDAEYAIDVADGSNNNNKIRAAAFVTYSDESLKTEVQTMNTALDTVMSLEGVEFTWKNSGERDFGFIAQDVQRIIPKAVHTAQDGIQGVDYSRLTSILVEAVKAQQVQIDELKALLKK